MNRMNKAPASPKRRRVSVAERRRSEALQATRALARGDKQMGRLIKQVGPHRPILTRDTFVTLFCSIVHQQISMSAAASVQKKLAGLCPRGRFTPAAILSLTEKRLRSGGLSRQKAAYVRDLAAHFEDGRISGRKLRALDDGAAIELATQVKGIGRWTAEMLLMFCLERPDVWPIDDLGIQKAVRNYLGVDDLPDKQTMQSTGERWRPYRSYASWYLWRSLEGPLMPGIKL